jgi:hypothetical protein
MASQNAANLPAKRIAVDAHLTAGQVIAIMEKTVAMRADGRLHLVHPKAALADLTQNQEAR